jgi:hypothetical protein
VLVLSASRLNLCCKHLRKPFLPVVFADRCVIALQRMTHKCVAACAMLLLLLLLLLQTGWCGDRRQRHCQPRAAV